MFTEDLERAFSIAREVLKGVRPDQYDLPTPCAAWDVRRLLSHFVGAPYRFAHYVNVGSADPQDSTETTDYTKGDLLEAYDKGVALAIGAFQAPGAQERMVTMPFGDIPVPVFMAIGTNDVFTHAWDLAKATGQPTDLDPAFAERMTAAARTMFSEGLRGPEGAGLPFGGERTAPEGSSPADRHAAFLGRDVT